MQIRSQTLGCLFVPKVSSVLCHVLCCTCAVLAFLFSQRELGLVDLVASDPDRTLTVASYVHAIHLEVCFMPSLLLTTHTITV